MHNIVTQLSERLDAYTEQMLPICGKLVLYGDWNSPFLKSVRKKAEQFGVECDTHARRPLGVIIDEETAQLPYHLRVKVDDNDLDIDNCKMNSMTSAAQATYMVLNEMNCIEGKNISIVGRGHAVSGLAGQLVNKNATVTVAHSKTRDIFSAVDGSDVIVYATPELIVPQRPETWDLVVDLGGVWSDNPYTNCAYINRIGALTVSILMNRLAKKSLSALCL